MMGRDGETDIGETDDMMVDGETDHYHEIMEEEEEEEERLEEALSFNMFINLYHIYYYYVIYLGRGIHCYLMIMI